MISSGVPMRPKGMLSTAARTKSSAPPSNAVPTRPGCTELTRMPHWAKCPAADFDSPVSPHLLDEYAGEK